MIEILSKLNGRLRRENRRILLFMDNAPCHPEDLDEMYEQIKIVFLPQTTTSIFSHFTSVLFQHLSSSIINACLHTLLVRWMSVFLCRKCVVALQAIRWTAMACNDISETTVVKCFIKAGILDSEGNTNTVESSNNDVDPFAELESELLAVEDLANETSDDNSVSLRQVVDRWFDAPVSKNSQTLEDFRQV